jgi:hypothetical protein
VNAEAVELSAFKNKIRELVRQGGDAARSER